MILKRAGAFFTNHHRSIRLIRLIRSIIGAQFMGRGGGQGFYFLYHIAYLSKAPLHSTNGLPHPLSDVDS